jgi:hypothetical protein
MKAAEYINADPKLSVTHSHLLKNPVFVRTLDRALAKTDPDHRVTMEIAAQEKRDRKTARRAMDIKERALVLDDFMKSSGR